uniref:MTOR associated protein, eak-7-like protein n=1 Tax=Pipistrellus kuhlii TaxID=59472 RepID=A0A7J7V122_PIPKU|nr:MTOR associated protein, eak-7-like protein [Pipistrellus kuhlii]
MGNSGSRPEQSVWSQFLPEEQAEVDRLFDALSSEKSSSASPRSFSLEALKSHIGEALPPDMVARLYDGMRRVDLMRPAKGPSESVSREQFTASMSHLLKGSSREKSFMVLKMISATDGPVKAREVLKFTEDLVGSLVHVLSHRQELRGWAPKRAPGPPPRVQALAAQLLSEVKLAGKSCWALSGWTVTAIPL